MSQRELVKLIYLYTRENECAVFAADLPDPKTANEIIKMRVQGPIKLIAPPGEGQPEGLNPATPVYDSNREEIHWATSHSNGSIICRITKYLKLGGSSLMYGNEKHINWVRPCVGLVSGMRCVMRVDDSKPLYTLRVRIENEKEHTWKEARPFDQGLTFISGYHLIIGPPESSVKYVLVWAPTRNDGSDRYNIYSIQSNNFLKLTEPGSDFLWSINYWKSAWNLAVPTAYVLTQSVDESNKSNHRNLLVLQLNNETSSVEVVSIKLRQDGSVDSESGEIEAKTRHLNLPPGEGDPANRELCATLFGDGEGQGVRWYLFITWQGVNGIAGMITELDKDGNISEKPNNRKKVLFEFDRPISGTPNEYRMSSVLVARDFTSTSILANTQ